MRYFFQEILCSPEVQAHCCNLKVDAGLSKTTKTGSGGANFRAAFADAAIKSIGKHGR
jgi:hypothetical protein